MWTRPYLNTFLRVSLLCLGVSARFSNRQVPFTPIYSTGYVHALGLQLMASNHPLLKLRSMSIRHFMIGKIMCLDVKECCNLVSMNNLTAVQRVTQFPDRCAAVPPRAIVRRVEQLRVHAQARVDMHSSGPCVVRGV